MTEKEALFLLVRRIMTHPPGLIEEVRKDGFSMLVFGPNHPLFTIVSVTLEGDCRIWVHVSVSRRNGLLPSEENLPSPMELNHVKEAILGDVEAYTVMPVKAKHVNIHPGVLHFFYCLEPEKLSGLTGAKERPGAILPDFTKGSRSL
jgi:hypothetical protein